MKQESGRSEMWQQKQSLEWRDCGFEDAGGDHMPKNAGGLQKLQRARKQILLQGLQKEHNLANTLILTQ